MAGPAAVFAEPDSGQAAFLGVEKSLTGKRWLARPADDRLALALSQRLNVSDVIGRVLTARGIGLEGAADYFNPTLRASLPDPSILKDMDIGAERLASAIMQGERVAVFGDYDVDGATSSALLLRFFRAVGADLALYVPDRLKEGYGPNEAALLKLRGQGVSVVVTVDCGTAAHEPLRAAAEAGLDVIVVDHHVAETHLPKSTALINPNRLDEPGTLGQLAAVGVTFLLLVALNRTLRGAGWYRTRPEPNLLDWLDLVALGTICDVVPLTGINRALVTQGLKVLGRRGNAGLRALADVAGLAEPPGTFHAGFIFGPRVNAGGRIGASDLGARLLSCDDDAEAFALAERLDTLNSERRNIEARVLEEAILTVEGRDPSNMPLVMACGEGWHPGVIGIVASRLKDRYNMPAIVVALDAEKGVASGRSVTGVDLGAAVIAARQAGLLEKGGGHKMAAGFTVLRDKLDDLSAFLAERIGAAIDAGGIVPRLLLDGSIQAGGATRELIDTLERAGPFGSGNPEPKFVISNARIAWADLIGKEKNHLRCTLKDEGGGSVQAICFRAVDTPIAKALLAHDGAPFHVAGRLRLNTWQGVSKPQLLIDDAAPVW
ncbi:MAG: single-stranded-DNA-specific exonuclease RecJ [Rhodospirillales bacterium]